MNDTDISKAMTYFLRHRPEKAGLSLGEEGYVSVSELLEALQLESKFEGITSNDIERVVANCPKQRFERVDDLIRARYGHSVKTAVTYDPVKPPDLLYHGTSPRAIEAIRETGLLPMERQYVHLSTEPEQATTVGKRHSKKEAPVILRVNAGEAWESGVKFYHPEPRIFLSDPIPVHFLIFEN